LEPSLDKIPDEVKSYIGSEEDKLTYALFPQTAQEFFKKRKPKQKEAKTKVPPGRIAELEEVAAVSVAVAAYLTSSSSVKALIPVRTKGSASSWVLAGRQSLAEHGA
jgi:hypothetical protein